MASIRMHSRLASLLAAAAILAGACGSQATPVPTPVASGGTQLPSTPVATPPGDAHGDTLARP